MINTHTLPHIHVQTHKPTPLTSSAAHACGAHEADAPLGPRRSQTQIFPLQWLAIRAQNHCRRASAAYATLVHQPARARCGRQGSLLRHVEHWQRCTISAAAAAAPPAPPPPAPTPAATAGAAIAVIAVVAATTVGAATATAAAATTHRRRTHPAAAPTGRAGQRRRDDALVLDACNTRVSAVQHAAGSVNSWLGAFGLPMPRSIYMPASHAPQPCDIPPAAFCCLRRSLTTSMPAWQHAYSSLSR